MVKEGRMSDVEREFLDTYYLIISLTEILRILYAVNAKYNLHVNSNTKQSISKMKLWTLIPSVIVHISLKNDALFIQ